MADSGVDESSLNEDVQNTPDEKQINVPQDEVASARFFEEDVVAEQSAQPTRATRIDRRARPGTTIIRTPIKLDPTPEIPEEKPLEFQFTENDATESQENQINEETLESDEKQENVEKNQENQENAEQNQENQINEETPESDEKQQENVEKNQENTEQNQENQEKKEENQENQTENENSAPVEEKKAVETSDKVAQRAAGQPRAGRPASVMPAAGTGLKPQGPPLRQIPKDAQLKQTEIEQASKYHNLKLNANELLKYASPDEIWEKSSVAAALKDKCDNLYIQEQLYTAIVNPLQSKYFSSSFLLPSSFLPFLLPLSPSLFLLLPSLPSSLPPLPLFSFFLHLFLLSSFPPLLSVFLLSLSPSPSPFFFVVC